MDFKTPSYITKNRLGIYYFQLRIPKQFCQNNPHLTPLIRKSLGTRNRREALRLARNMVVLMENNDYLQDLSSMEKEADKHNALFHSGKSLFEKLKSLEKEGDQLEIEEFFTSLNPGQEIALRYVADENKDREDAFSELLSSGEYKKALEFYEKTPRIFQKNLKSLWCQHTGQSRLINVPSLEASPALQAQGLAVETPLQEILQAIQNQHKQHINRIPLQEAFERFIAEKKTNWKGSNNEQHYRSSIFALFSELVGDVNTGDLEKSHVILYKDAVLKLPKNRNKMPDYKHFTAKELMIKVIPEEHQFKARNKQKYLENLSGFLQWLQKNDLAVDNLHVPLQNVVKETIPEHLQKPMYSDDDLRKLFNSSQYCEGKHDLPNQFWVPLIGLLTGARENEICQLHLSDIYQYEETGIWIFDINEDDSKTTMKSVKKGEHARLVPIHPKLIDLGLLEFIDTLKLRNEVRLFPDLPFRGKNKYADKFQRWYNITYRNAKNCNITTPKTSFHSLRHTFGTYLSNELNIPPHQIAVMLGQKPDGGVTVTRYIKPIELQQRYDIIKQVNFDKAIDFTKIKNWRQHPFAKQQLRT